MIATFKSGLVSSSLKKNEIKLHLVPLQNLIQSFIYRSRLKNDSAKIYKNTHNFTNQYIHTHAVITNYPTITDSTGSYN